jgi:20S proteasome alpha/beta subunit
MTVVVGIYCSDGVVIAADSALTIGSVIEQSYAKKVACISDNLIVAFAGDLGFAQRFRQVAKDICGSNVEKRSY